MKKTGIHTVTNAKTQKEKITEIKTAGGGDNK